MPWLKGVCAAASCSALTAPASLPLSPQSIDPGQQFTWENSNLEVNKPKNRYANVIAYDHSRVILTSIDGKWRRGGHPSKWQGTIPFPVLSEAGANTENPTPAWLQGQHLPLGPVGVCAK